MKHVSGEIIHKKIRPSQGLYFGRKRYLRKTAISFLDCSKISFPFHKNLCQTCLDKRGKHDQNNQSDNRQIPRQRQQIRHNPFWANGSGGGR